MRKIEQQMCDAVRARKNWSNGNTRVEILPGATPEGALFRVYLHGNLIAGGDYTWSRNLMVTLAGWPTVTTRSRVNAILRAFAQGGAGVYQSKCSQFFSQWGKAREIGAHDSLAPTTGAQHAEQQAAAQVQL